MGAFTGTLDFATNDNNITLGAVGGTGSVSITGTGARTLNMGDGTWTIAGGSTQSWDATTTTNLTLNANGSTITYTGALASGRTFTGGSLTYNNFTIGANSSRGATLISGSNTFNVFTVTGPNSVFITASTTQTVTSWVVTGSGLSSISYITSTAGNTSQATITDTTGTDTLTWAALRSIVAGGGATFNATSSFDLGNNSGISITEPSLSGGAGLVIA